MSGQRGFPIAGAFLTTEELAERWAGHVQAGTLINWRQHGQGPKYLKPGGKKNSPVIYNLADVIAYEKKHTITPNRKKANRG